MQSVVNSLAVLAFLGVALLLFANSALLKLVRDLQAALADLRLGVSRVDGREHLHVPALANSDGEVTYLLVVDGQCPACADRARHFVVLAADGLPARLMAASADGDCSRWFDGSAVAFHHDAGLVGHIGVSVTPTLVRYDAGGHEQWRRVVASDQDMDRLIDVHSDGGTGPLRRLDRAGNPIVASVDHE